MTIKDRNSIDEKYKWDLSKMYTSDDEWMHDIELCEARAKGFTRFKGCIGNGADMLYEVLSQRDQVEQILEKVFVYARMKLDEDNRVAKQQEMYGRALSAVSKISSMMSFVMPEIISIPEETIKSFIAEDSRLFQYTHVLDSAIRQKKHVLSKEEENILAQLSEVLGSPDQVYTMLCDADMNLGMIKDEEGNEVKLTHGNYIKYMRSYNRNVRKAAFESCYTAYKKLINTISTNYATNVKTDVISARLRHYDSSRAAALSSGNISEEVYDNLVATVNEYLPVMYEYTELRKEMLGVDEMKMYDVYVPLIQAEKKNIEFEEALDIARAGLAPLGKEYIDIFNTGVKERWMDVYENEGKTSGAYSFGSYDSLPYVLLNYSNTLEDVFTIVHEMGHSINSYYTRKTQPFTYGDHSIFTAEVASTVNETLLMKYLLENEKDPETRKYILNMYIEAYRTTLFRQTMFAEFEHLTHKKVENGDSLTAEWMNKTYDDLNTKYFGPALSHDDYIKYEWARIPHFYRSFYVYQYATGYSAANAIANKILTEGEPARDAYIKFLGTGSCDYPVELLKIAGVNMASKKPVSMAMETFKSLVAEFKELCK